MRDALALFEFAQWLSIAPIALLLVYVGYLRIRHAMIARNGRPGVALIEDVSLVRSLPRRLWEVRLGVTYFDQGEKGIFRVRQRWDETTIDPESLQVGSTIHIRFGIAGSRRIVMPEREA
jgi:hypothetical protein